jgi:hypothetical protein
MRATTKAQSTTLAEDWVKLAVTVKYTRLKRAATRFEQAFRPYRFAAPGHAVFR